MHDSDMSSPVPLLSIGQWAVTKDKTTRREEKATRGLAGVGMREGIADCVLFS